MIQPRKSFYDPVVGRRVKLLPCQREMVIYWHHTLKKNLHYIADVFQMRVSSIYFIVNPDANEKHRVKKRSTYRTQVTETYTIKKILKQPKVKREGYLYFLRRQEPNRASRDIELELYDKFDNKALTARQPIVRGTRYIIRSKIKRLGIQLKSIQFADLLN
jgi:hypothetical protein